MNTTDFESPVTTLEDQETANISSTYSVASINCQATTGPKASVGNIEKDSPPDSEITNSSTSQGTMKVFAPVIAHDVTLPNAARKVPMVMVPVPDSRTLMAIPISTLSHLYDSQMDTSKDQQQARDLLVWNDGVGTLDGCDLRFKINQLGCLELLDSDDELENHNIPKPNAISSKSNQSINTSIDLSKTTNGISESILTNDRIYKKVKLEIEPAPTSRQISPGSSLLRDGPNMRRPTKTTTLNQNPSTVRPRMNSFSLLKKVEYNQNSILLEKLVPKQKVEEIKTNVEQWTTEDVKRFVNGIPGCSGYGELFESQQICGRSLMYLDQRDLIEVINVKLGPAVKIYHAISLLK